MTQEQMLIAWARGMVGRPFSWGAIDCAMLALSAIDVMRGTRHADRYRGTWVSQDQALQHFAIETPSAVLAGMGAVDIPAARATVGDVVTVPADIWPEQMAVILGSRALCADVTRGVCLIPSRLFTRGVGARAWRFA